MLRGFPPNYASGQGEILLQGLGELSQAFYRLEMNAIKMAIVIACMANQHPIRMGNVMKGLQLCLINLWRKSERIPGCAMEDSFKAK